jgi:membrane-associated phospholipid phosphatase
MTTTRQLLPDNRNRFAFLIGRIFHPYLICIPSIFAILSDFPLEEAVKWSLLVFGIVLTPGILASYYVAIRYKKYLYQRETRGPLYLIGWTSVIVCLGVLVTLNAPRILIASLMTLVLWLPAQTLINQYVTKISAHAGVVAGCATALLLYGKLNHPLLLVLVIVIALITMWSRIATKNHTLPQVVMGFLLGALPVLVVFPLML